MLVRGQFVRYVFAVALTGMVAATTGCRIINQTDNQVLSIDMAKQEMLGQQLVEKGNHYVAKNQFDKAASFYDQAIAADSTNAAAYNNLGLVFFFQHDFHEAARAFQAAHEHQPEDPAPLNNLGLIMETVAHPNEALDYYREAHEMAPTNPEYLGNLVRAKIRLKMVDDELREQIHSLLLFERRLEWQDWAREQLGLFNNPYLDRGPPKPSSEPLKGISGSSRSEKDTGDRSFEINPRGSSSRNSGSNRPQHSPSREPVLALPQSENRIPSTNSMPTPLPIPDPLPDNLPKSNNIDSFFERLE
jgi:tetratricopeptide (TPR) repeat protein